MNTGKKLQVLFGMNVKELRNNMGLTQDQLAEKADIATRTLGKIERGDIFVSAATLVSLSRALKVDVKELFEFNQERTNNDIKAEIIEALNSDNVDYKFLYKALKLSR